jgi:hypothetical protein
LDEREGHQKQNKAHEQPLAENEVIAPPEVNKAEIQAQIDAIRNEKIPKERDTPLGRRVWEADIRGRIAALKARHGI